MRRTVLLGLLLTLATLAGCAAGSATAGYSVSAGSADDLKSEARSKIVGEAVKESNAYTDRRIDELRRELAR